MMILIVDGVVMDIIEMMVDKKADLVLHMEVDKVTKDWKSPAIPSSSLPPSPTFYPAPSPPSSSPW